MKNTLPRLLVMFSLATLCRAAESPQDSLATPATNLARRRSTPTKSGPQQGDVLRPFLVRKCAGNVQDGVAVGKKLCYRCKLGNRPVVLVFARTAEGKIGELLRQLDELIGVNGEEELSSFVSLWGAEAEPLRKAGEELVKQAKLKHIAVVLPEDLEHGPRAYQLNAELDFTVLVYREGRVVANFAMTRKELNRMVIDSITQAARRLVRAD